jgi:hypothetical protein
MFVKNSFRKKTVEDLVKMLDSEEEMLATDYRIPMSIGDSPHAEVCGPAPFRSCWFIRDGMALYLYEVIESPSESYIFLCYIFSMWITAGGGIL